MRVNFVDDGFLYAKNGETLSTEVNLDIGGSFCSLDEEVLHMSGSLIPAHTGSIRWLGKNLQDLETERFFKLFESLSFRMKLFHDLWISSVNKVKINILQQY